MTERIDSKDYAKVVRGKSHTNARGVKTLDGYFGSKKEFNRWQELKLLEKSGDIRHLRHHEKFPLVVNEIEIKKYEADFTYYDLRSMCWKIEDSKGRRFREWIITKKLLRALYPSFEVIES